MNTLIQPMGELEPHLDLVTSNARSAANGIIPPIARMAGWFTYRDSLRQLRLVDNRRSGDLDGRPRIGADLRIVDGRVRPAADAAL